jgi:hypothetical protein
VEFVVDKVTPGQVFSEYFGFPCQFWFIFINRRTIDAIQPWHWQRRSFPAWVDYKVFVRKREGHKLEDLAVDGRIRRYKAISVTGHGGP